MLRKEVPNQYSLFMWYAILSKIFFLQLTPARLKLLTERPMGATTLAGANGAASTDSQGQHVAEIAKALKIGRQSLGNS